MKQFFLLSLAVLLVSSCGFVGEQENISTLYFIVKSQEVKAEYLEEMNTVIWDEGDKISFQIDVMPSVRRTGGLIEEEDFIYQTSGQLVYEDNSWHVFVKNRAGEFSSSDGVVIWTNTKEANVIINFDYESEKHGPDWFTVRHVISVPFQENEMFVSLNPADLFSSKNEAS